jgi:hypothetical protein
MTLLRCALYGYVILFPPLALIWCLWRTLLWRRKERILQAGPRDEGLRADLLGAEEIRDRAAGGASQTG